MDIERVEGLYGVFDIFSHDAGIRLNVKQFGAHQPSNLKMLLDSIAPGDHVLDIGAHVGTFAVPMAKRCAPGPLVTVEGTPATFDLLRDNLTLNHSSNATPLNRVVSETTGFYEVNFGGASRAYNTGAAKHELASSGVQSISLNELIEGPLQGRADCIKVDVEGMDLSVLQSGADAIRRLWPIVCFELILNVGASTKFAQLFGPGYAYFLNVEPSHYEPDAFLPLLVDDFPRLECGGQQDVFAVPVASPVYARWAAYLNDAGEVAYRNALFLHKTGRREEALARLAALGPQEPRRLCVLHASLLALVGDVDKARALLDETLAAQPNNVDAMLKAAQLARQQKDNATAVRLLERAVRLKPMGSSLVVALVKSLQMARDPRRAMHVIESFNSRFGEHPKVLFCQADVEWRQGKRDLAIEHAKRAGQIRPTDVNGRLQLARYFVQQEHADLAIGELRDLDALLPGRPAVRAAMAELQAVPLA